MTSALELPRTRRTSTFQDLNQTIGAKSVPEACCLLTFLQSGPPSIIKEEMPWVGKETGRKGEHASKSLPELWQYIGPMWCYTRQDIRFGPKIAWFNHSLFFLAKIILSPCHLKDQQNQLQHMLPWVKIHFMRCTKSSAIKQIYLYFKLQTRQRSANIRDYKKERLI